MDTHALVQCLVLDLINIDLSSIIWWNKQQPESLAPIKSSRKPKPEDLYVKHIIHKWSLWVKWGWTIISEEAETRHGHDF